MRNKQMKKMYLLLLILLSILSSTLHAQRYQTDVFSFVDSTVNIAYGAAPDYQGTNQILYLDFYEPQGDPLVKRPLLIYVHGGGFTSGSRKLKSIQLICEKMAKKGYAVANIDYRLDPNFSLYSSNTDRRAMTDAMHDLRAAIRFFKANRNLYKVDTANIIIGGESAGAATAMMSTYVDKQSELISYPQSNPNDIEGNSGNPGYSSKTKTVLCLCGLLIDTLAMESSNDNPYLWVHGSSDPLVPISFAEWINIRADHIGLSHQKHIFQGATHCPWYYTLPNWETYLDSTVNYITDFLYPRITTGLHNNTSFLNDKISAYPNPFNQTIQLFIEEKVDYKIELLNALGQTVYIGNGLEGQNTLNTAHLIPGVYYLKMTSFNNSFISKLIKQETE
jgi:pimeloyl-ACP methyl ester carboxylesterase